MKYVNFEAFFLGPKGENVDFYQKLVTKMLSEHVNWRKAFHYQNESKFITEDDMERDDFKKAQEKIENTLLRLSEMLKQNQPFFSPRYIGHMNWEVMMAPVIAFFSTALYNPNNVARAGGTGTSDLELKVGEDFLKLFGYDETKGWGHICAGGTIANIEALWIARNMKVIPLALKRLYNKINSQVNIPRTSSIDKIVNMDDKMLIRSFSPIEILDLKDKIIDYLKESTRKTISGNNIDDDFEDLCMQERGLFFEDKFYDVGVVYLPETKHYSFAKAMDLLGLGRNRIRTVPVDKYFRMNTAILKKKLCEEKSPILAVIAVAGSTEESSVDEIDKIVQIRNELKKERNINFHIHIDAAYGGYVRSLFLDENNNFG